MASYRAAFSLSEQEVKDATPPGTIVLISHDLERTRSGHHEAVYDHVRLSPAPSSDPADPLNWPVWRKGAILTCMSVWAWLSNFQSAGISSAFPLMITAFIRTEGPLTFAALTHLLSVNVLFLGSSNIIWVPLANSYGRRPVIVISLLMFMVFSIWGAIAKSYDSLLAARLFMGLAMAPAETIAPDVVGEVFFVHQRGRALAIYTVMLASGPIVGGMAGSYIATAKGWRFINWINVILGGVLLLAVLLLEPETLFDRNHAVSEQVGYISSEGEKSESKTIETMVPLNTHPFTFWRSLKFGVNRDGFIHHFMSPFSTLLLPGVWMVMLQCASLVAGIITVSVIGAQLVSAPPYLWGGKAGLINVGGLIGAFLGAFYTYLVADWILKQDAKREAHGYSEPEARLKVQIPSLIIGMCGMFVFGACAAHPGPKVWVGLQFGYGMLAFALMQVPSVGYNYIIEAYNSVSSDCFVMIVTLRSIVSFAWTFFIGDWVEKRGPMEPFGIFGMLVGIFTLLTLPQIIWGKRTRITTAKWVPEVSNH